MSNVVRMRRIKDGMLRVSGEEFEKAPPLGKTVKCWICGEEHEVVYGEQRMPDGTYKPNNVLAFFQCGEELYLCGIAGKEIRPQSADSAGAD
jgi:hypothetical protein